MNRGVNIAICDDNNGICTELKKHLMNNYNFKIEVVKLYNNGRQLINDITLFQMNFDLIYMDIHMPVLNGIETAMYIRKFSNSKYPLIIFMSNYDVYAEEITTSYPYYFLKKPFSYDLFDSITASALHNLKSQDLICFNNSKTYLAIDPRELIFVRSTGRKTLFYEADSSNCINITLKSAEKTLCNDYSFFIRINNTYIINIFYVKSYTENHLILKDGLSLSVSRKYREILKSALSKNISMN